MSARLTGRFDDLAQELVVALGVLDLVHEQLEAGSVPTVKPKQRETVRSLGLLFTSSSSAERTVPQDPM